MDIRDKIAQGRTALGIELGSTRIKATLIDDTLSPVAGGAHEWENRLENGYWTYSLESIDKGVKCAYAALKKDVFEKYGVKLSRIGAIGISAMMHGYMAFDENDSLLVPFRTWRNTTTSRAAGELSEAFRFNIPERWSIAHLYQAILDGEEHLSRIAHLTTLAGYIHFTLTGRRVLGVGEASGMFPINGRSYDKEMLYKFDKLAKSKGFEKKLGDILPDVLFAGDNAGELTEAGARYLDTSGELLSGAPLCPPEGDAGTGMTATNSVRPLTGNVSAGTSVFAMLVLDKPLKGCYPQIDIVTTPDGSPVAMVHCNNCCSELDAWVKLFYEFAKLSGNDMTKDSIYDLLYKNTLNADDDCGGVCAFNFLSGEPVAGISEGRPMYFRLPDSKMNLANFFKAELYSSVAALKMGMDILFKNEGIRADSFTGHGGLFKTEGVAQKYLSDALDTPVSVMTTAGEGGSYGIALLAAFMLHSGGKSLADWLDREVFDKAEIKTVTPDADGAKGFDEYIKRYTKALDAARMLGDVKNA